MTEDKVALTTRCGVTATALTELSEGDSVALRFAIAGADDRCYAVTAVKGGQSFKGYVPKAAVAGAEQFEQSRKDASRQRLVSATVDSLAPAAPKVQGAPLKSKAADEGPPPEMPPMPESLLNRIGDFVRANQLENANRVFEEAGIARHSPGAAMIRAKLLLDHSRPAEALRSLKPALQLSPKNASLLAMAGVSAYQADRLGDSLDYLQASLKEDRNPYVQQLHDRVSQEVAGDQSHDRVSGTRFTLRYEGEALPDAVARQLTTAFDREITEISYKLGCRFREKLAVVVQSRENYQRTTGAAEWSGGQFNGRIHIALMRRDYFDEQARQTFAHEIVHACLAKLGPMPAWIHEGLAQRLSGQTLPAQSRDALRTLARSGRLPQLSKLGLGWSGFSSGQAAVAYSTALAAADYLYRRYGDSGLRRILKDPAKVAALGAEVDRVLADELQ